MWQITWDDQHLEAQIFGTIWAVFYWSLTIMNLTAFRYIQKKQKPLEPLGIEASTVLMVLYCCFWIGFALCYSISITLSNRLWVMRENKVSYFIQIPMSNAIMITEIVK